MTPRVVDKQRVYGRNQETGGLLISNYSIAAAVRFGGWPRKVFHIREA